MEQKTFETAYYYDHEEVICINVDSKFDGLFTEAQVYEVLAYNVDTHMILVQDDDLVPCWVEAEFFVPVEL